MATIIKGTGKNSFEQLYNSMQSAEDQIAEGDLVELYFEFDTGSPLYNSYIVSAEASTLDSALALKGVEKWPGLTKYTFIEQNGKILRVRWRKGFLWLLIVIPLIFAILVGALVYLAFWELNKYSPVVKGATSKIGLYLAVGAFLLVIFPAIFMAAPSNR